MTAEQWIKNYQGQDLLEHAIRDRQMLLSADIIDGVLNAIARAVQNAVVDDRYVFLRIVADYHCTTKAGGTQIGTWSDLANRFFDVYDVAESLRVRFYARNYEFLARRNAKQFDELYTIYSNALKLGQMLDSPEQ